MRKGRNGRVEKTQKQKVTATVITAADVVTTLQSVTEV